MALCFSPFVSNGHGGDYDAEAVPTLRSSKSLKRRTAASLKRSSSRCRRNLDLDENPSSFSSLIA